MKRQFSRLVVGALVLMQAGCAEAAVLALEEASSPAASPSAQLTTTILAGRTFVALPAEPPQLVYWTEFGEPFDSYFGVVAYSNGKMRGNAARYQCTELIHRYVSQLYGFPSRIGLGMGNGNQLAQGIADYFRGQTRAIEALGGAHVTLEYFASGASLYPPLVGSIVSMHMTKSGTGPGHVAIIRELAPSSSGALAGTLFAQHGALPLKVGAEVPPDTVTFTQDERGRWSGSVYSPFFKREFPIVGWTSVVVEP